MLLDVLNQFCNPWAKVVVVEIIPELKFYISFLKSEVYYMIKLYTWLSSISCNSLLC